MDENYLSNLQKQISDLDFELIRLNTDLIKRRGSRKWDLKRQIKNIQKQLDRKQDQLKLYYNQSLTTPDTNLDKIQQALNLGKNLINNSSNNDSGFMPDLNFDEIIVTSKNNDADPFQNKESFFTKYKSFLIGGGVLLLLIILMKKKIILWRYLFY